MKTVCKKEHSRQGFEIKLGQVYEYIECPINTLPGRNQTHMLEVVEGDGWQASYTAKQFKEYFVPYEYDYEKI